MNHNTKDTDVASRAVISVHTKPETSRKLGKLASLTRRSKSFLANEAIERYIQEESSFISSVKRGMIDSKAGRVHTTSEAKDHIRKFVSNKKSTCG